jgi:hypothetical protein
MKQLHNVAYVFLILAPGGLGFMMLFGSSKSCSHSSGY